MRIMIARILGPMLLALFLGGAVRAQEMTGQSAEKTKKELLEPEAFPTVRKTFVIEHS